MLFFVVTVRRGFTVCRNSVKRIVLCCYIVKRILLSDVQFEEVFAQSCRSRHAVLLSVVIV